MTNEQVIEKLYDLLLKEFLDGSYADSLFDAPCRVEDITINSVSKIVTTDSQLRIIGNGTVESTIFLGGGEAKDGIDSDESEGFSFSISTDLECSEIEEVHYIKKE